MSFIDVYESPVGTLRIVSKDDCITNIDIEKAYVTQGDAPLIIRECKRQLQQYFNGEIRKFTFSIAPEGTDFQKKVWSALRSIEWGQTKSYTDIAEQVGNPKAVRAAANACGKNPILIVIPCHRCLAKDGLGGFSCGIERKKYLLALESKISEK